jgi:glycosyltransferase involved in cell wall biosynthesis
MRISVIIPALNEEKYIERCLRSIVEQDLPRESYEIIVVDGGSRDATRRIARRYADKLLLSDRQGIGYQQNLGAEMARGDLLVFVHADTYFIRKGVFRRLLQYFDDEAIVGGAVSHKYYPENRFGIKVFNTLDSFLASFFVYLKMPQTGGPVTVIRRDVFFDVGGFIENICEDVEIGKRLREKGRVFRDVEISAYSSSRRLEKEGILRNVAKYVLSKLAMRLGRSLKIKYPQVR